MRLRINTYIVASIAFSIITLLSFWAFSYLFAEVIILYLGFPFALFTFLFFYVLLQRNGKEWVVKIENILDPPILLSALTVFSVFSVLFVPAYGGSILQWVDIPLTNWLRCGASLLLSSFLPGYFLLKVLDNKGFIRGGGVIVTSFLLSLFISFITTFLILIAKGSILSITPPAIIAINLFFLSIYLYNKKKQGKTCFYDMRISSTTALLVSIFVIVMVGSFIVMYYNFPVTPGDMWGHLSFSNLYSQGFPVSGSVSISAYPYLFYLYLATYFSMAGIPSAIALQSLYVLSFMPVLAFYLAVNEWVNEKKDKGSAVLATSLSILLGFGSLYALYLELSGSSFALPELLQVTAFKTYDIYFRVGYLPDIVAPLWEIGIPVFLMLLYLLKKDNGETIIALLIALFVATGYLGHVTEIIVFALVFLVYCSFFQHKFSWKINTSVLFGLFIVAMIDILAPSRGYITAISSSTGAEQISLPYSSAVVLSALAVVIPFVKKKIKISFPNKKQIFSNLFRIWKYARWLLLYFFLFSMIVWLSILDNFSVQASLTPFYILPIRLGPVLLLALCAIFVSLPNILRDRRIAFFIVLMALGFMAEQISNYSSILYEPSRYATFTFVGACVIAAYGLRRALTAFSKRSLMKKALVCILLLLVITPGMLSTSLFYVNATYYSGRGTVINSVDFSALNYVKQNLPSNASVITMTAESATELETFAGLSPVRVMNYLPIVDAGPSLLLYVIGNSNVKYVYMNQMDEAQLENTSFLCSLLNYLPISYCDKETVIYSIPSLSPPVAGSKTLILDTQPVSVAELDVSSFEYYSRGGGVIENYGASVGDDGLVLNLTTNSSWVSYALWGLDINTTIGSVLSFNFKTSENALFTMILHFEDGTTQWIYRLQSPEFTTETSNLAEGKVITGIEVLDELTQQNISSGSIYLNSIEFSKPPNVVASTIFSILQLDYNSLNLPSTQLSSQFYGNTLKNVSTVILTSDPQQDLDKAIDWVQEGGNLMIMGGLTNGYFSNLLGIKPVPVAQLNFSDFEYYTQGGGVIENYGASVGDDGLVLNLTTNSSWVSYALWGLDINTTIGSVLSFNFKTSENALFTMILHFEDGTTQWIYRLQSPEFTTETSNLAEGKVITGIEVLDELTQQNISSGSIYLNSIEFSKPPVALNAVLSENGQEVKIPSITVPQITAENATASLYFTNLDTRQSTPFGFYKKIGNGTVYFVLTDPILSAIENLSDSNIRLLESMLNLTMNASNLQIPSYVSSMGTLPDYNKIDGNFNTVNGNVILNGNATIVSNYIDSTEQILAGTVTITSESLNAEFRSSTIESLNVYGEATLLVNDSSELLSLSGFSPSTIILNSNESAECTIILSNKTNVELNIEDSYGENHSITVADGTVYFNSNKLSLLFENPKVEVTGETLFESLAVHIAPYTLLAGALNNVNIEGYCSFKMDYAGGGSALISNFVYDGTAKELVYPSSSQQESEIPWMAICFSPLNALTIICLTVLFVVNEMRRSSIMSRLRMKRQVKCG